MPNTVPVTRVPQPQQRNDSIVRTTSLRALAVAAHLERSRITPGRHGPGAEESTSGLVTPSLDAAAEPAQR